MPHGSYFSTEDLTGRKFGDLTVLGVNKVSMNGGASWRCRCECGRECVMTGKALLRRKIAGCGKCSYGQYEFYDDYVECTLLNGAKFQIDKDDYEKVSRYRWHETASGYFMGQIGRNHRIFLHRLVMPVEEGYRVDHRDLNKANCRKANLRICTSTENNRNTPLQENNQCGFKGVYWASDRSKWRAEITVDRNHIHLGSFDTAEEAARAYDSASVEYFGDYARTNDALGLYA